MNERLSALGLDPDQIAALLAAAGRAPSLHNSQPWRFRLRPRELHADTGRHLPATDPDRRDLVLSCGIALHHLLVTLAALGLATEIARFPDPENRTHLATVGFRAGGEVDTGAARLLAAIAARRTDRRRFSRRSIPPAHLAALIAAARRAGGHLLAMTDGGQRRRLLDTLAQAAAEEDQRPGYPAELRAWTHRYAADRDAVPVDHLTATPGPGTGPTPLRRFTRGTLRDVPFPPAGSDSSELLVITTPADDPRDRLRAGEATSAVLLTATALGLATTSLSQAVEIEASRTALAVLDEPQLIIRVGWPATGAHPLPATPRRPLRSVLLAPHSPPPAYTLRETR